jgi:hypothetical protein
MADQSKIPQDPNQLDPEVEVAEITDPDLLQKMQQLTETVNAAEADAPSLAPGMSRGLGDIQVKVVDITAQTDRNVYDNRPNGAASIAGLLLHHTASASENGDIAYLSNWHDNPVSIHKVIRRNGTIVKIVPEDRRAWHAGPSSWRGRDWCNDWMIGYEICNKGNGEPFTDAQYEAIAQSIAYDCALYHIKDVNVATHKAVRDTWLHAHPGTAALKNDPLGLDLDRIWQRVTQIRDQWPFGPIVALWSDSGQ